MKVIRSARTGRNPSTKRISNHSRAAGRKASSIWQRIRISLKDNLKFPENFDPEKWIPEDDEMLYTSLKRYTVQVKMAPWALTASWSIWDRSTRPHMVCSAPR